MSYRSIFSGQSERRMGGVENDYALPRKQAQSATEAILIIDAVITVVCFVANYPAVWFFYIVIALLSACFCLVHAIFNESRVQRGFAGIGAFALAMTALWLDAFSMQRVYDLWGYILFWQAVLIAAFGFIYPYIALFSRMIQELFDPNWSPTRKAVPGELGPWRPWKKWLWWESVFAKDDPPPQAQAQTANEALPKMGAAMYLKHSDGKGADRAGAPVATEPEWEALRDMVLKNRSASFSEASVCKLPQFNSGPHGNARPLLTELKPGLVKGGVGNRSVIASDTLYQWIIDRGWEEEALPHPESYPSNA